MNSDKVQYNPQLDDAAHAICEDDRELTAVAVEEALADSCDGATVWLMKAWASQTMEETEKALGRVLELDPENELALSGMNWVQGISELAEAHLESKQQAEEAEAKRKAEEEAEEKRKAEKEAEAKRKEEEAEAKRKAEEETEEEAEAQAEREAEQEAEANSEDEDDKRLEELEKQMDALPPVVAGNMGVVTQSTVAEEEQLADEEEILAEVETLAAEVKEELANSETDQTLETKEAKPVDSDSEGEPASSRKQVVLAVDDSPTIRKLVSLTLVGAGYEVLSASDGVEALNVLNDRVPDIVLSDINMPKLNGYKLCKFIKKHELWKSIPVVMLSGKDGMFDKMRGKLNGCDDFISKPFESADLIAKVREHLAEVAAN
ncbi:MAG: response regulator [Planctomycetota bacterium]